MVQNTQSWKYYRPICHRCEYESELMSYEALYVHDSLNIILLKQTLNIINAEFQITVLNKIIITNMMCSHLHYSKVTNNTTTLVICT